MISPADVEKLRTMRAPEPAVLSLYLPVPLDPAQLRELPARAGRPDRLRRQREGFSDTPRGPGRGPAAGGSPRPGLAWPRGRDIQLAASSACWKLCRCPVRSRNGPCWPPGRMSGRSWPRYNAAPPTGLRSSTGGTAGCCPSRETASKPSSCLPRMASATWDWAAGTAWTATAPSSGSPCWRAATTKTSRAILEREARAGDHRPLVIGGHPEGISQLLSLLPQHLREQYAGSFTADPHTLTTARVRELAGVVIADWVARREQQLAAQMPGPRNEPTLWPAFPPAWPQSTPGPSACCSSPTRG